MEWFPLQSSVIHKKHIRAAASAILREKYVSSRGIWWKLLSAITVRLGMRWTAASAYTHFCTNMSEHAFLVIQDAASAILRKIFLCTSVGITFSHRRSPWYAMDRGKRQYTFWHQHERTRVSGCSSRCVGDLASTCEKRFYAHLWESLSAIAGRLGTR